MDYSAWTRRLSLILMILQDVGSGGIMGPADINLKFVEKCKWTSPTLIDMKMRMYQRKGQSLLNANATFPYPFSDELGDVNVAVKRSGAWISNFFKIKGKGVCSGLMKGDKALFKMLAKQMNATMPPHCPLPGGTFEINYNGADPTSAMKTFGLEVMPFGEFRVTTNITRKADTIICLNAYVDVVPKKGRSG